MWAMQLATEKSGTRELRDSVLNFQTWQTWLCLYPPPAAARQEGAECPFLPQPPPASFTQSCAIQGLPATSVKTKWALPRGWGLLVGLGFGWFVGIWQTLSFGPPKVESQPAFLEGGKLNNHLLASLAAMDGYVIYSAWEDVWWGEGSSFTWCWPPPFLPIWKYTQSLKLPICFVTLRAKPRASWHPREINLDAI